MPVVTLIGVGVAVGSALLKKKAAKKALRAGASNGDLRLIEMYQENIEGTLTDNFRKVSGTRLPEAQEFFTGFLGVPLENKYDIDKLWKSYATYLDAKGEGHSKTWREYGLTENEAKVANQIIRHYWPTEKEKNNKNPTRWDIVNGPAAFKVESTGEIVQVDAAALNLKTPLDQKFELPTNSDAPPDKSKWLMIGGALLLLMLIIKR